MTEPWKLPMLERFLGPDPSGSGYASAESLLGLPIGPRRPTRERVGQALQRRLEQMAEHPEADSDQATVVRQWLMQAAEELWAPPVPTAPARARAAAPGGGAGPSTLGESGSPARRGRGWLVLAGVFAGTAALSAGVLWLAVVGLPLPNASAPTPGTTSAAPAATASPASTPASTPRDPAATTASAAAASGAGEAPPAAAVSLPMADLAEPSEPEGLLRAVRQAANLCAADREQGLAALLRVEEWLARRWPEFSAGERTATLDALLEAVLNLSADRQDIAAARAAVAPMLARAALLEREGERLDGGKVAPTAWSVGVLLRLERERELPRALTSEIATALAAVLGGERQAPAAAFPVGALTALRAMPVRLVRTMPLLGESAPRDAEAVLADLRTWIGVVRATVFADGTDPARDAAAEGVILDGLQRLMTQAAEPTADPVVFQAITAFGAELRWRRGEPSRARLLRWFEDPAISASDLNVLTTAIVGRSSAEGVDLTMILPATADARERGRLRQAYASAWGLSAGDAQGQQTWAAASRARLAAEVQAGDAVAMLRAAAVLAVLNRVAALRDAGRSDEAEAVLRVGLPAVEALELPSAIGPGAWSTTTAGDQGWAARFVRAKAPAAQIELLKVAETGGVLDAADAEILVDQAVFSGSTADVREAARQAALARAADPQVIHAVLKVLPRLPRSAANAALVERACGAPIDVGWQNERWPVLARAALVESLLGALAAGGSVAVVDRLAVEFAAACEAALEEEPPADPAQAPMLSAADAAERLFRRWRAEAVQKAANPAAPLSLEQIDRRLAGRLTVARGPIQRFSAFRVSAVEVWGFILTADDPAKAPLVQTILVNLHAARRNAGHIAEQLLATEAALLRLRLISAPGEEGS
jgi:hypothetical protein